VLGPLGDATYERGFVRLKPGDTIVLYTDGMLEASPDAGEESQLHEYGQDRLVALARSLAGRSAREMVEAMLLDVERFTGDAPVRDDRTVVVVRYPG
jgi:sigma-B regulation protein RsbU (phosphoserine phosphatase)